MAPLLKGETENNAIQSMQAHVHREESPAASHAGLPANHSMVQIA